MNLKTFAMTLTMALAALSASANGGKPVYLDNNAPMEVRVQDALSRMTVHEKIGILHAHGKFWSGGVARLGIPGLWHSDGPHGCRAEVDWNTWGNAGWTNDSCVAFPSLTCLASTWNTELSSIYGLAVGEEFAYRNKNILLGPGCNIARHPMCGRNFEYMGEDPYLAGEMCAPYIESVQSLGVACCLKHFFANSQETDRMEYDAVMSERTAREIYLPAFQRCVNAGVWSIMGSYNKWLGVNNCQNDSLLNGILKREWGFDGAVVSDWGGTNKIWEAATGGLDIEMGSFTNGKTEDRSMGWNTYNLADPFEELINQGKIPMSVLDEKAGRVLRLIFRTAMNPNKVIGSQCSETHYEACLRIGEEGIVLLKNEMPKGKKDRSAIKLLPLEIENYGKVLVVGENATRDLAEGGGSSELKTKRDITPLEALKKVFGDRIDYAPGYYSGKPLYAKQGKLDEAKQQKLRAEVIEKAKSADLIIFIGGLNKNGGQDCEGCDRVSYNLSFGQDELISELATIQKNIVVVTYGGNAYATPWLDKVPALVHSWYLGSMSGEALANILTGKVNPSGKLPVTFAKELSDYPAIALGEKGFPGVDKKVYYDEGIFVGYRHFDNNPKQVVFPFGHGLSYTTFKYGKAQVQALGGANFRVTVDVTNTGSVFGKEAVQLYVGDEKASVDRPKKELKGFQKVALAPGQTKTITFDIDKSSLSFWDETTHQWKAEPGKFKAYVAASSADIRSTVDFTLTTE